ncbi:hypothetical protein MVEN_02302700 [Mycena venus]|uniref:Carbohydrate-binding module family 13 protein n=1 Tax=Mycena venus TaxID=2733690 RepID=A0A8H7CEW6_9AGAR|nr:hypothetical protein MVEN_02302700 [Mycena venus]
MFSFSKVLAFGLVALSSVRAIPFTQVSCSVDFGTSVGPTHAFNAVEPGFYLIINVATNTPVIASAENGEVGMAIEGRRPDDLGKWELKKADQGGFKIYNVALKDSPIWSSNGELFCGKFKEAETFAVEPAGPGVFNIKEVNRDDEWTVLDSSWPIPLLRLDESHGRKEQLWRLIPVPK